ncbi:MAG TPA: TonB-dependent receptor [Croceibacterium sp.]|nr:TonB-dependent receptor [Croceibacterium sp.]
MVRKTSGFLRLLLAGTALSVSGSAFAQAAANDPAAGATDGEFAEIVVTATRQSESIGRVPISISAYNQEALDSLAVRKVDDIARISPGITFARSSGGNGNQTNIAIRGISSTIGAATTGVYINDTPVQVRMIGVTAASGYPLIFDLERVEVLRGPQGTLFGASAQGGAVRFITPRPDLDDMSVYGRAELSSIEGGSANYEAGVAVGVPLVTDTLGMRASAWYRHDGGWVDRVGPLVETGYDATKIDKNINQQDSMAFKLDLLWQPDPAISILPSIYYQKSDADDINQIYEITSDPDKRDYNTPNQLELPSKDWFLLSSLGLEADLGGVDLVSNTSYFEHKLDQLFDYTYQSAELNSTLVPYITIDGQNEYAVHQDTQKAFTQEFRLQSQAGGRLNWVLGGFYMHSKQRSYQDIVSPYTDRLIRQATGGALGLVDIFGSEMLPGDVFYRGITDSVDEQLAGFGQVDFNLTDELKLTAGVRVSRTTFKAEISGDGPLNGGPDVTNIDQKETPITPKFGISYQADPSLLLYASAAKGFRTGGSQPRENSIRCAPDLAELGLTETPTTYKSDSLWSYEIGAKKRFGNALSIDTSAYVIKWNDMQQRIILPSCGSAFIVNLGSATSKGFDVSLNARPVQGLTLSSTFGYNKVYYDETIYSVPPVVVRTKGSRLPTIPLTFTFSAQYDFPISNETDGYFRSDFQHNDAAPRGMPTDYGYDPLNDPMPKGDNLDFRLGMRRGGIDVNLFVNNALDKNNMQYFRAASYSVLFRAQAPKPRTFGINATYRY